MQIVVNKSLFFVLRFHPIYFWNLQILYEVHFNDTMRDDLYVSDAQTDR